MNLLSDRKYALAMLILSMVYCVSAILLDADFNPVNEKYYPFVLSMIMILLSMALMVWPTRHTTSWPGGRNLQKIGLVLCAILVYSLVLHTVGFLISASVLMGICMWVFEADKKWIVLTSVICSVSFYIIFDRLLGLTLPAGLMNFF